MGGSSLHATTTLYVPKLSILSRSYKKKTTLIVHISNKSRGCTQLHKNQSTHTHTH